MNCAVMCVVLVASSSLFAQGNPSTMAKTGTIDPRFQSYNVEMVEVVGGRFWKPYDSANGVPHPTPGSDAVESAGVGDRYEYRPPIDLGNPKLRRLAGALGPAYMRVSGSWANGVYFDNKPGPAPAKPPDGFESVLTQDEWRGVLDFARSTDAKIITSLGVTAGSRDKNGVWTPAQMKELLDFTRMNGGSIAAVQFMNEPSLAVRQGVPAHFTPAAFVRDVAVFTEFMKKNSPDTMRLGPDVLGDGSIGIGPIVKVEDLMAGIPAGSFTGFAYHFYYTASQRCVPNPPIGTREQDALTTAWLGRSATAEREYAAVRDRFMPGASLWLLETAQAACGGDRWAATYLDTFRYLDQLGLLARAGVQVVAHNTLASSDYGLLESETFNPRPNYWAALLWRRTMGTTVLDAGSPPSPAVRLYSHCQRDTPGGVTILAINLDREMAQTIKLPSKSTRYTLSAKETSAHDVLLNGKPLALLPGDQLPALTGSPVSSGAVTLPPASSSFLTIPSAGNPNCR
jgi:heparanase 1